ncbi:hypothetical protein OC835_007165, partial [Tilletia horrida]
APSPVAADDRQKDGEQQQEMARLMAKEVERWGQAAVDANQPWRFDQGKRALFPAYQLTTSPSVRDVWEEYTEGSNGRWGTRMMEQTLGTGWRGGAGMKQEWSRRKKVIDLIEEIARARPSWTEELAMRFLEACCGGNSPRGRVDWLSKTKGKSSSASSISAEEVPPFKRAHVIIFQRLRTYRP